MVVISEYVSDANNAIPYFKKDLEDQIVEGDTIGTYSLPASTCDISCTILLSSDRGDAKSFSSFNANKGSYSFTPSSSNIGTYEIKVSLASVGVPTITVRYSFYLIVFSRAIVDEEGDSRIRNKKPVILDTDISTF